MVHTHIFVHTHTLDNMGLINRYRGHYARGKGQGYLLPYPGANDEQTSELQSPKLPQWHPKQIGTSGLCYKPTHQAHELCLLCNGSLSARLGCVGESNCFFSPVLHYITEYLVHRCLCLAGCSGYQYLGRYQGILLV